MHFDRCALLHNEFMITQAIQAWLDREASSMRASWERESQPAKPLFDLGSDLSRQAASLRNCLNRFLPLDWEVSNIVFRGAEYEPRAIHIDVTIISLISSSRREISQKYYSNGRRPLCD